jgi:hypothetical protein
MIDPKTKKIALIDHGSAFAGESFDPAHDENSFVPFYLRAWAPKKFNALREADKLRQMPRLDEDSARVLSHWLSEVNVDKLSALLIHFGIDPQPDLERLAKLKLMASQIPADEAVNRFWVET